MNASYQERRLMFAAVARVLANVAGPAGTLLVRDDLQWAGPDALDLLAMLVRSPSLAHRERGAGREGVLRVAKAAVGHALACGAEQRLVGAQLLSHPFACSTRA